MVRLLHRLTLLFAATAIAGCWSDGHGSPPAPDDHGPLRDAAKAADRLVGAAISNSHLGETDYTQTAATSFNYLTPENEMKWDATEPTRGSFTFAAADAVVAFAQQHNIKVKGHTLVWYSQLPSWVSALTSADDVRAAMVDHITQMMTHFKGKVAVWDVVNEAWQDGTTMRSSPFYDQLGSGYIDEAFMAARAADPGAKLYYNDYAADGLSDKANAVYNMVADMKARGVPIDGVGLQMHTVATEGHPPQDQLVANMQRLGALGLEVVVSEMDVNACGSDLATQATKYHDVVAACVAEPACKAVTVWGVTDKYSWLNGSASCGADVQPLLYDGSYTPKPAFDAFVNALMGL